MTEDTRPQHACNPSLAICKALKATVAFQRFLAQPPTTRHTSLSIRAVRVPGVPAQNRIIPNRSLGSSAQPTQRKHKVPHAFAACRCLAWLTAG
jgi:hypothetical protein